jgi:hypothetical protein
MTAKTPVIALAFALAAGCATGTGADVRKDVIARMKDARPALETCYETALTRNRKLKGEIELMIVIEPKTGKFKDVTVKRDELADDEMQSCVITAVTALKLAKPQETNVSLSYPFAFSPVN